jgi:hypothetical protein
MTVHFSQVRLPQLNGRISEATATVTPDTYVGRPNPTAARSNAWVYGRSLADNAGSKPTGGVGVCLL